MTMASKPLTPGETPFDDPTPPKKVRQRTALSQVMRTACHIERMMNRLSDAERARCLAIVQALVTAPTLFPNE